VKELLEGLQIQPELRARGSARRRRSEARRGRVLRIVSILAVPALLGSWYVVKTRPVVVNVFTIEAGADGPAPTLTAGGYARAARVVYVAPRVSGRLAAVLVSEGDEVQAGDLIATIDSKDLEQEAAEARANYELAQANLGKLELGSRPEEIAEARAKFEAVARAKERSERDLARSKALFEAGLISAQAFDQAKTEYLVGESNLDSMRQSLALVEAGPRKEEIDSAKAALAAAHARWVGARNRLDYAKVQAPSPGRVLRKFRNAGDFVSPDVPYLEGYETVAVGSPVVSLADLGRQEVSADVNETDIARVSLHQPVQIAPNAYPGELLPGSVTQISPRADKNKNTIEVKVTLEKAARVLPYDMSVKLSFLGQPSAHQPRGTRIPSSALVERDGKRFVFVVSDSRASQRVVEVGAREDEMVAVTEGLADGDRVIVSKLDALKEGTPIRLQ
jgi:RND family efflux transporter MFP subunit